MEPGGRRRPDLYAEIPVSVLQVPAGKEGEAIGLPNFLTEKKRRSLMRIRRRMMRERRGMRRRRRRVLR